MKRTRNDFSEKNKSGRRSFYIALWTAAICLLAVGGVYYNTVEKAEKEKNQLAAKVDDPNTTPAGNGAIGEAWIADADGNATGTEESRQASAIVQSRKKEKSSKKKAEAKKQSQSPTKEPEEKKDAKETASKATELSFNEEKGLVWPVKGEVIMKFSEKNTIYFKTLAQYRSNPAIEISAKEGTGVKASAAGTVTDISKSEETGTMVTTSIGNGYTVVYGQLKDVNVKEGQAVKEGDTIGKVAAPTKYFTEEGSNLYFQVTQNKEAVDPLLLLQ